ncbi:inactive protein kinase SELMODRAFT_444075 isoform X1 [Cryptomeria japonica]|uniref:inactive protein kinase SELMODRAFT_444075 isoform X1 n=1 Tax=Cryptomeria japonica TaxID=3369 RepID=UPI0027DAA504|nr:inactive protein kinase SELMODRAFT_444075 isoform X1 [Cryptomeria japonica]
MDYTSIGGSSNSSRSSSSNVSDQTNASLTLEQQRSVVNEDGHQIVVAIVDASKEITLGVLKWVLEKLQLKPGDKFIFLGVLQQINTPSMYNFTKILGTSSRPLLGSKTRADPNSQTGYNMNVLIEEERQRKKEEFDRNEELMNIQRQCEMKQIQYQVEVKAGASTKVIAVDGIKACEPQPTLVILDRHMKEKKYFLEKLKCNILRVKRNNTIEMLRGPFKASFTYDEMLPELSYSSFHLTTPVNTNAAKDDQKVQFELPVRIEDTISKAKSMNNLCCPSGSPVPDIALDTNADNPMQILRSKSDSKLDINKAADATTNVDQVSPVQFTLSHLLNSERSTETSESSNLSAIPGQDLVRELSTVDSLSHSLNPKITNTEVPSSSSSYKISECEICKYRSPNIGRELKSFDYSEIQAATNNFSSENFISEGGFGLVYKGRLEDGQHIAVKQHKEASSQGEKEFRSEVEVLSYAQHKNLVTLLGFCSQDNHRLLVYEYVCNGSLDKHLSNKATPLQWKYRKKIAEGTARGLRYLHEECRGGCIVHRDMRPNNILVTHDFEPMVGDFGLARSQKPLEADNETRVVGSFGYLAPEYAESGKVSTKTDVYSFGMVLLELITGRKALDRTLPGQSLLAWARPLLDDRRYHELIDPLLMDSHDVHELYCMVRAAGLCLRKDPTSRPTMNQVVKILEGSMMNQLEEDSPTMGGSESFIQMIETSPSAEERSSQSGRKSHAKKKSSFTYYEML